MDQDAPAKPREQKVSKQRTRWKILLLILCLLRGSSMTPPHRRPHSRELQVGSPPSKTHLCTMEGHTASTPACCWKNSLTGTNALRGPRLVSGEPGGAVTIHCHYAPSSVNRHQRKYWCRLGPPLWICYTVVSTNHYTHHDYRGRVVLTDFPQSSLFMVKLSQLSLNDTGLYRCGIGDRNDMLFFRMNLIVSAGPSNTTYAAAPASGELITASPGIASAAANRWTTRATLIPEGQGSEWDRTDPTTANRWTPEVTLIPDGQGSEWDKTDPTTANRWTPGSILIPEGRGSKLDRTDPTIANRWTPGVTQIPEGKRSEWDKTTPTTANRWTPGVTPIPDGQGSEWDRTARTIANRWTPGVTPIPDGQGSEWDRTTPTTANRWTPGVTPIPDGQGSEWDKTDPTTANRWTPGATPIPDSQVSEWDRTDPTIANRWTPGVTLIPESQGSEWDRTAPTTANRWIPGVTPIPDGQGSEWDRTAQTIANRWTPGATLVPEAQGSEWDRTALTTRISETTASTNGRQTPRTARTTVPGTSSREEGSIKVTVPTPESPASKSRSMFSITPGVRIWGTRNSVTMSTSTSEGRGKGTAPEADGSQEETDVSASPGALRKTTGTTGPSVLISEHGTWETLQEATEDSKQQTGYSVEESSPGPSAWMLNTIHTQVASGSIDGSLGNTDGESSPATPSQLSSGGPRWAPGQGSSMKSAFTGGESNSWILTPVSTVLALVLLVALVLFKRRLWRERTSQEAERPPRITLIQMTHFLPDKLLAVGKNLQLGDPSSCPNQP